MDVGPSQQAAPAALTAKAGKPHNGCNRALPMKPKPKNKPRTSAAPLPRKNLCLASGVIALLLAFALALSHPLPAIYLVCLSSALFFLARKEGSGSAKFGYACSNTMITLVGVLMLLIVFAWGLLSSLKGP
jgi:hypothetical protein